MLTRSVIAASALVVASCARSELPASQHVGPLINDGGTTVCGFDGINFWDDFVEVSHDRWQIAPSPIEVGCIKYAVRLELNLPPGFPPDVWSYRYDLFSCNKCSQTQVLYWQSFVENIKLMNSDELNNMDTAVDLGLSQFYSPEVLVSLVDEKGTRIPQGCPSPHSSQCQGGPGTLFYHQLALSPGKVIAIQGQTYPATANEVTPFADWRNKWNSEIDAQPVRNFDVDSELGIVFQVPHFWPSSIQPQPSNYERQVELACFFAGFPASPSCGFALNLDQWRDSDLLDFVSSPVHLPSPLLGELRDDQPR